MGFFEKIVIIVCLFANCQTSWAQSCGKDFWQFDSNEVLSGSEVLISTHLSYGYTKSWDLKDAADRVISRMQTHKSQIIHLFDIGLNDHRSPVFSDCSGSQIIDTATGGFDIRLQTKDIISIGGTWGLCHLSTMLSLLRSWENTDLDALTITLVSDAIYALDLNIYENYPFKKISPPPESGPTISLAHLLRKVPPQKITAFFKGFTDDLSTYVPLLNEVKILFVFNGKTIEIPNKSTPTTYRRQITFNIADSDSF